MQNKRERLNRVEEYTQNRWMSFGQYYFDCYTGKGNCTAGTVLNVLNEMQFDPNVAYSVYRRLQDKGGFSATDGMKKRRRPLLMEYAGIEVYEPDEDAIIVREGLGYWNLWKPLSYKPAEGDVSFFLEHLKLVLKDDFKVTFLLDFLAYRFQNPREKAHQALYLFGKPGSGKGTFKDVLKEVFGESAIKYAGTSDAVKAIENWGRTFFVVDEIELKKSSKDLDQLKAFIVEKAMEGKLLYQNYSTHVTSAQLIMFSNHRPSFIDATDRRFFIADWSMPWDINSEEHKEHFRRYREWMKTGIPALGYFLLNRDLSKYEPYASPPMTEEKRQAGSRAVDSNVEDILDYLDEHPTRVLFTVDALMSCLGDRGKYFSKSHFLHLLERSGMTKEAEPITVNNKRYRVWIREGWTLNRHGKPNVVVNGFTKETLTQLEAFEGADEL